MNAAAPRRVAPLVSSLGLVQIISWGTLYYSIGVLGKPVATSLGLGEVELLTAFGGGLLVSGILAPAVGRLIDLFGGRVVMTVGSLLAVISFLLLATATNLIQCYAGWLMAGLAMTSTLYDAVFASLRRLFSDGVYRRAVTLLTIFGGFASTAFWPLSEVLNQTIGWRWTYILFALAHVVGALVHLSSPDHGTPQKDEDGEAPTSRSMLGNLRFLLFALGFASAAFVFSAISTFAVGVLSEGGLDRGTALFTASLIGPMQVAGRLLEFSFGRRVGIQTAGTIAHGLVVIALLVLCFVGESPILGVIFAVAYGLANGTMTIVRGTVPVLLLQDIPSGRLLGGMALPSAFTKAASPAVFAFLAGLGGNNIVPLVFCACVGLVSLGSYCLAIRLKSHQFPTF